MIVCVCEAVRERDVRSAMDQGCRTVREVGRRCRAGTDCGACVSQLHTMLQRRRDRLDMAAK